MKDDDEAREDARWEDEKDRRAEAEAKQDAPIECPLCGGYCDVEGICLSACEEKRQRREARNDSGV